MLGCRAKARRRRGHVIDEADSELTAWIERALGADHVTLSPPPAQAVLEESAQPMVSVHLMDLVAAPDLRRTSQTPLRIGLRYLISVAGPSPPESHAALGKLVFAAMQEPSWVVELEPPSPEFWLAMGAAPRPAFVITRHVAQLQPELADKPVKRVVAKVSTMVPLIGRVLGPDDVPLAGARVELPSLTQATRCDERGRFRFPAVPAAATQRVLRVSAKGKVQAFTVDSAGTLAEPVLLRFQLQEE